MGDPRAPSDVNSHPHFNEKGTIAVVHNGIIENYLPLKKNWKARANHFISETDTEVPAHMLDSLLQGRSHGAIVKVLPSCGGPYALGILFPGFSPGEMFAVRKDSPLHCRAEWGGLFYRLRCACCHT